MLAVVDVRTGRPVDDLGPRLPDLLVGVLLLLVALGDLLQEPAPRLGLPLSLRRQPGLGRVLLDDPATLVRYRESIDAGINPMPVMWQRRRHWGLT